jgi:hypothetical protein
MKMRRYRIDARVLGLALVRTYADRLRLLIGAWWIAWIIEASP